MDSTQLHEESLVIDLHNDTLVAHIRRGNWSLADGQRGAGARHTGMIAFLRGHEPPREGADEIQINLDKMRRGGIDVGFYAIDVTLALHNHLAYALDGFGYLLADIEASGVRAPLVRSAADARAAYEAQEPGIVLAIEHADCVHGSLYILRTLHALGVRSIGLTHNVSSRAADGCLEARDGVGLTHFGVSLVQEMNRLGVLVDLAHVSPGGFFHALEVSTRPVIFSHGNARALCDHPRNLDDAQLAALGQQGGVIGLSFVPMFVDAARPTLERYLDHAEHVASVAGIDALALGSDFGGGTLVPDATHMPRVTAGLVARGFSQEDVRKVLGLNALCVLERALQ